MPIVNQISQVIFQMTVIDSSSHDSGSDVGCHYQDSCMEKAIMFLVLLSSSECDCGQDVNANNVGGAVSVMIGYGH